MEWTVTAVVEIYKVLLDFHVLRHGNADGDQKGNMVRAICISAFSGFELAIAFIKAQVFVLLSCLSLAKGKNFFTRIIYS